MAGLLACAVGQGAEVRIVHTSSAQEGDKMALDDVFIASANLERVTAGDVARATQVLGTAFPDGYLEYVTTLGVGFENDFVTVLSPAKILEDIVWRQAGWREFASYDFFYSYIGLDAFPVSCLVESIPLADTVYGDVIVFHRRNPAELFCIPRNQERFVLVGATLDDVLTLLASAASPLGPPMRVRTLLGSGSVVDRPVRYFRSVGPVVEEGYLLSPEVSYMQARTTMRALLGGDDREVLFLEHLDPERYGDQPGWFQILVRDSSAVIRSDVRSEESGTLVVTVEYDPDYRSGRVAEVLRYLTQSGTFLPEYARAEAASPDPAATFVDDEPRRSFAEVQASAPSPYRGTRVPAVLRDTGAEGHRDPDRADG